MTESPPGGTTPRAPGPWTARRPGYRSASTCSAPSILPSARWWTPTWRRAATAGTSSPGSPACRPCSPASRRKRPSRSPPTDGPFPAGRGRRRPSRRRELLATVLDLTAARRRRRRWREASLGVAAALIIAVGVFGGLRLGSSPAQLADGHRAVGPVRGPANGPMETVTGKSGAMTATVSYSPMGWGTQLDAKVSGIPVGTNCQLWVIDASGNRVLAGDWVTDNDEGKVWYPGSVGAAEQGRGRASRSPSATGRRSRSRPRVRGIASSPGIAVGVSGAGVVVVGGLVALVVVLAAASAAGFVMRQRQGRFRPTGASTAVARTDAADSGRASLPTAC